MLSSALVVCLCSVVLHTAAVPVRRQAASQYKRLIVFGDSFSDNGSGAWVVSNETWPADPAYYNHTFS